MSPLLTNQGDLQAALRDRVNPSDRPAAVVFNSHITGLAVARSLGRRGVPIIALDRDPKGFAFASRYATVTALCPYVLNDEAGFIEYLVGIGRTLRQRAALYPTNDEWVLAVNRHRQELERYFLIPFSGAEIVEPVLDKARLYRSANELAIPIPRTWYLDGSDTDRVAGEVPYPCIIKPTEQRSFYDAFGDKAWRIESRDEFGETVARAAGHTMVAQEIVGQGLADFYSVCSYIGRDGQPHGVFVGRKLEQYPPDFGTGCLVTAAWVPAIAQRGVKILQEFGYQGISEVEFIYDAKDREHKLLDVNTRVWKWIGLPIAAGVDLPWLAYADVTGAPEKAPQPRDGIVWTYAHDYVKLRLEGRATESVEHMPEQAWADLFAGRTEHVVDAVIDPSDPGPAARMMENAFNPTRYFCAC